MKRALILGASGGIGGAVADNLNKQQWDVTTFSRSLNQFDITNEDSVTAAFSSVVGPFDLIFIATGALEIKSAPEKSISHLSQSNMIDHFMTNTIGPALILKHLRLFLDKKSSSIVSVLSARVGSIEDNKLGGWYSYRASKAALNQIVKSFSIELSMSHPKACLLAIHPGTVDTKLTNKYATRYPTQTPKEAAQNILDVILNKDASHTGRFYDWANKGIPW
tara:strand:- start:437 stop:1099 length:663 start_codon:yes stop_codon:yes gene_type:complete